MTLSLSSSALGGTLWDQLLQNTAGFAYARAILDRGTDVEETWQDFEIRRGHNPYPHNIAVYLITLSDKLRARLRSETYFMAFLFELPAYYQLEVSNRELSQQQMYPPIFMNPSRIRFARDWFVPSTMTLQQPNHRNTVPIKRVSVLLQQLLYLLPNFIIAGGAASACWTGAEVGDFDVFIVDSNYHIDEYVRKFIDIFDSEQPICIWNSLNAISVSGYIRKDLPARFGPVAHQTVMVQLIKTLFRSREQVLESFDLDSSAVGIEYRTPVNPNKKTTQQEHYLFWTERFELALMTGTNLIRPGKRDKSYIGRLVKYSKRGFRPFIPGGFMGLESMVCNGLTGGEYTPGGLEELVYAMYHSEYRAQPSGYTTRKRIVYRRYSDQVDHVSPLIQGKDLTLLCRQLRKSDLVIIVMWHLEMLDNWRVGDSSLRTLSVGIIETDFYLK